MEQEVYRPLLGGHDSTTNTEEGQEATHSDVPDNDPIHWNYETVWILRNSFQLSATYLLSYVYSLSIIIVVSRLGTNELAAVALGVTVMNICGYAIFEGIATSLDTLCSQAYGSGKTKLVGLHVQRNILLMLLVSIPIGAFWICSPWILRLCIPQPELAPLAGTYLRVTLIGIPGYAVFEAGKRLLQAQGDFTGSLIILLLCVPVLVFLNWLFVFCLNWGVAGAALAVALTSNVRPVLLLLYVVFVRPSTLECWQWPGDELFRNWGPMVKLSVPGAIHLLCEWFAYEILTFSSSYLGIPYLAAQSILATIGVFLWHIPFSAGVAMSTRIGFYIGRGTASKAKGLLRLYAPLILGCGLLEMTFLLLFGSNVARLMTKDAEVRTLIIEVLPILAIFTVGDASLSGSNGVLRGLGKQAIAAWSVFVVNYSFALPFALYLELGPPRLGLAGIWIGCAVCTALITAVEAIAMRIIDWQKCVEEARGREESHI